MPNLIKAIGSGILSVLLLLALVVGVVYGVLYISDWLRWLNLY